MEEHKDEFIDWTLDRVEDYAEESEKNWLIEMCAALRKSLDVPDND